MVPKTLGARDSLRALSAIGWLLIGGAVAARSVPETVAGDAPVARATELCTTCHATHGASSGPGSYLLSTPEELVCLECHGGFPPPDSAGAPDILAELQKPFAHPVLVTPSVHRAGESPTGPTTLPEISPGQPRHAECSDCHDPHEHGAPPGSLPEIWGITEGGSFREPVLFEYEICLKCHGDSANKPQLSPAGIEYPRRQSTDGTPFAFNQRLELGRVNPSFHPVFGPRGLPASEVPSLRPFMISPGGGALADRPLGPATRLRCGDCHANDTGRNLGDGSSDPAGPHGSSHGFLLERAYELEPSTVIPGGEGPGVFYSRDAYALCDKCHDVDRLVRGADSDSGSDLHEIHVQEEDAACATCHAPHGVFGGTPINNSMLIDFDLRIVAPNSFGLLRFEDRGFRTGACYLRCHGEDHDPEEY